MPQMPKRVKYRKSQRGKVKGNATRGNTVSVSTSVTVIPVPRPTIIITPSPVPGHPGAQTTLAIQVTLPTGISVQDLQISFGDGQTADLGGATSAYCSKVRPEKALGSGKYDFPTPSDQDLRSLASKSVEINAPDSGMKSSVFDRISYDPDKQLGLLKFAKPGAGGVKSYAIVGMTPEKWEAFAKGLKPELGLSDDPSEYSMGKYFNNFIKKYENTVRVYDDLWGQQKKPPGTTILNPESAPTAIKDFLNKTKN